MEFGIINNYPNLKKSLQKNKTAKHDQLQVKEKDKVNEMLAKKLSTISSRNNQIKLNEEDYNARSPILKKRSNFLKTLEEEKILKENIKIGERLSYKQPSISLKSLEVDYSHSRKYKEYNQKFYLPHIETLGNKFLKNQSDGSGNITKLNTSSGSGMGLGSASRTKTHYQSHSRWESVPSLHTKMSTEK
jgi:hypothetical protein